MDRDSVPGSPLVVGPCSLHPGSGLRWLAESDLGEGGFRQTQCVFSGHSGLGQSAKTQGSGRGLREPGVSETNSLRFTSNCNERGGLWKARVWLSGEL